MSLTEDARKVADRLKAEVKRWRLVAVGLAIAGALIATLAAVAGLESPGGKVLAFVAAILVALGGLVRPKTGYQAVRDWTRARSATEAIKSEVYVYLAGVGSDGRSDKDAVLDDAVAGLAADVRSLRRHARGIEPKRRSPPTVRDFGSYMAERVTQQITDFYEPQADKQQRLLSRVRVAEVGLALIGAVLAAAAGTWELDGFAVWVPVVTTISAAVTAHAAAERYEFLLVEYLRAADELAELRDRRGRARNLTEEQLIRAPARASSRPRMRRGWQSSAPATIRPRPDAAAFGARVGIACTTSG